MQGRLDRLDRLIRPTNKRTKGQKDKRTQGQKEDKRGQQRTKEDKRGQKKGQKRQKDNRTKGQNNFTAINLEYIFVLLCCILGTCTFLFYLLTNMTQNHYQS